MALFVAVNGYTDEEELVASVLNRPIYQLVERTNYLNQKINDLLGGGAFESVRIGDAALTPAGDSAPSIKDFVYINPATGLFSKAVASMSLVDAFVAGEQAYAVGLLVADAGDTGTVVLYGRTALATSSVGWDMTDLLESGEVFRNGPYFLSSTEAGNMTANPSGPMIYLGYFMEDLSNPGTGDYVIMAPQYRDTGEAHVHRAYPLYPQVAGTQEVVGAPHPDSVHAILGFVGETPPELSDHIPRLVAYGTWEGLSDTQYTMWISTLAGTDRLTSPPPTDFSDAYLHWSSSDSAEGSGSVRIWSYESTVPVGTKGLEVSLENPAETDLSDLGGSWDTIYLMDGGGSGDAPGKRSWIIDVPTDTRGWLALRYRQYFDDFPAVDGGFSFVLISGPHTSTDGRTYDDVSLVCAEIHQISGYIQPTDGVQLVIDTAVFEFDDDGTVTAGAVSVPIDAGGADESFINLLAAVIDAELTGVTPVIDVDNDIFMIGTPAGATVTYDGGAVGIAAAGTGVLTNGAGTADLLVFDQHNHTLVDLLVHTKSYWSNADYWNPLQLQNGLSVLPIPFDSYADDPTGAGASGDDVTVGDYWATELLDEAPESNFIYALGMHQSLSQYYPPVPARAAVLVLNGVEMDSADLFPETPAYKAGLASIYWYPDYYAGVPWPRDWVSVDDPGEYVQNALFHFVRMSIGNTGTVTSLKPAAGSPIRVLQCGTNDPASVGDLQLDLDLELSEDDANLEGYRVFKGVEGQKLLRGPVVEKIVPGVGVTVTQNAGSPQGQGTVTIGLADGNGTTGEFEEVALENAKQEMIGMFPYIRLLDWETGGSSNVPTGFTAKFRVPHTLSNIPYRVAVYMTVFGEVDVESIPDGDRMYAGIEFSYSVLADFTSIDPAEAPYWSTLTDGLLAPSSAIQSEIPLGKAGNAPIYSAYDPMLIHNNPTEVPADEALKTAHILGNPLPNLDDFPGWSGTSELAVRPGTLVAVRVSRADVANAAVEYTNSLGFINLRWALLPVS